MGQLWNEQVGADGEIWSTGKTEGKGHSSLLSSGEWRGSFHASKSLNIGDKELIQTLGLCPVCLLLPWHDRPAANSGQKGVIDVFTLKQSINTGVISNLTWSRISGTHLWHIDTSLLLIPRVIHVSFWHWQWLGSHPCTSAWISSLSSLPSLNWKSRYWNHCGDSPWWNTG